MSDSGFDKFRDDIAKPPGTQQRIENLLKELLAVVHNGEYPSHEEAYADQLIVRLAHELGVALDGPNAGADDGLQERVQANPRVPTEFEPTRWHPGQGRSRQSIPGTAEPDPPLVKRLVRGEPDTRPQDSPGDPPEPRDERAEAALQGIIDLDPEPVSRFFGVPVQITRPDTGIDLPCDLNAEDDRGYKLASTARAIDPSRVVVGAVLKAGRPSAWCWVRVVEVADGFAYLQPVDAG